jgi:hypothetical protein
MAFYSGRVLAVKRGVASLHQSAILRFTQMTALRPFFISMGVFVTAACGLAGFFVLAFTFFTYQGKGLDWIYPTAGLCVFALYVSGFAAAASGVTAIAQRIRRKFKR